MKIVTTVTVVTVVTVVAVYRKNKKKHVCKTLQQFVSVKYIIKDLLGLCLMPFQPTKTQKKSICLLDPIGSLYIGKM